MRHRATLAAACLLGGLATSTTLATEGPFDARATSGRRTAPAPVSAPGPFAGQSAAPDFTSPRFLPRLRPGLDSESARAELERRRAELRTMLAEVRAIATELNDAEALEQVAAYEKALNESATSDRSAPRRAGFLALGSPEQSGRRSSPEPIAAPGSFSAESEGDAPSPMFEGASGRRVAAAPRPAPGLDLAGAEDDTRRATGSTERAHRGWPGRRR